MITEKNKKKGLILFELLQNDFQKFEKEVEKLKPKDIKQIEFWWRRCSLYIKRNKSYEDFWITITLLKTDN